MKIAIASDDEKVVASHFGRTKGFVIFEVEGKAIKNQEYRPNTFTGQARGLEGAGHELDRHTPILNALKDCQVVITHGMGRRIYDDLKRIGIEVFITDETDVNKALKLYLSGELIDRPELGCPPKH
uniref:Iron-molybdenum cofactor biosynthesis protein n=1 Tax=candidate division WOR-3 bacterium TaxID=2052148 RepID=A0A7C6AA74_UNCW3